MPNTETNPGYSYVGFSNIDDGKLTKCEKPAKCNIDISLLVHQRINNRTIDLTGNNSKFILLYWNGGGCMSSRLSVNPELKSLILTETPDVFVYAESMVHCRAKLTSPDSLSDYDSFHHMALKNSNRRGISVFYLQKHRYTISKYLVSKNYDIIWVKLESTLDKMVFCFFYAPAEHRPQKE